LVADSTDLRTCPNTGRDRYMEAVLRVGPDAYLTRDAVHALYDLGLVNPEVETVPWLAEIAGMTGQRHYFLNELQRYYENANPAVFRVAHKMATAYGSPGGSAAMSSPEEAYRLVSIDCLMRI
jgi:hypothetical protein